MMQYARRAELFDKRREAGVKRLYAAFVRAFKADVRAVHRMDYQRVRDLAAFRKHVAKAREIIVKMLKLARPGIIRRIKSGIIALALPSDGVRVQVMAQKIHAVYELPLEYALELARAYVPAAAGKGFCEHLLFTKLHRDGRDLPRSKLCVRPSAKRVHPRYMLVLVEGHHARTVGHLRPQRALFDGVTREQAVVLRAPAVQLSGKGLSVQFVHEQPVTVTETRRLRAIQKQSAQFVRHFFVVLLTVTRKHYRRIARAVPVILRLVRKKAA